MNDSRKSTKQTNIASHVLKSLYYDDDERVRKDGKPRRKKWQIQPKQSSRARWEKKRNKAKIKKTNSKPNWTQQKDKENLTCLA